MHVPSRREQARPCTVLAGCTGGHCALCPPADTRVLCIALCTLAARACAEHCACATRRCSVQCRCRCMPRRRMNERSCPRLPCHARARLLPGRLAAVSRGRGMAARILHQSCIARHAPADSRPPETRPHEGEHAGRRAGKAAAAATQEKPRCHGDGSMPGAGPDARRQTPGQTPDATPNGRRQTRNAAQFNAPPLCSAQAQTNDDVAAASRASSRRHAASPWPRRALLCEPDTQPPDSVRHMALAWPGLPLPMSPPVPFCPAPGRRCFLLHWSPRPRRAPLPLPLPHVGGADCSQTEQPSSLRAGQTLASTLAMYRHAPSYEHAHSDSAHRAVAQERDPGDGFDPVRPPLLAWNGWPWLPAMQTFRDLDARLCRGGQAGARQPASAWPQVPARPRVLSHGCCCCC